jgi:hypothetical protein
MIRHLTTLVLCGVLGSMVLVGNAEACHKKKCGHTPVVCAAPAPVCNTTCAPKVCAPKIKHCSFKLPSFCHKKAAPAVACATPVYSAPLPVYYSAPVGYPIASPQTSAQH